MTAANRSAPGWIVSVVGEGNAEEAITDQSHRILSVEYTDAERKVDKLVLTVDNKDLSNFDDQVWKHGNKVRIAWGYPGRMSPTRECVITKVNGFLNLRIEAKALSVLMNRVTKRRTFERMKRSDVVRQIAEENGYGDALDIDATQHLSAPIKIAANLPYNIGTELLVRWLTSDKWPPFWQSLTLMFQREVAERIVAQPGSKAYGRLAILAQWRSEARIVMSLPPAAFTPPPKVASAVVHLTALPEPRFPADAAMLSHVVATAFNQRRKMLRSALKGVSPDIEGHLIAAGLRPTDRAEQIPMEGFCALARQLNI